MLGTRRTRSKPFIGLWRFKLRAEFLEQEIVRLSREVGVVGVVGAVCQVGQSLLCTPYVQASIESNTCRARNQVNCAMFFACPNTKPWASSTTVATVRLAAIVSGRARDSRHDQIILIACVEVCICMLWNYLDIWNIWNHRNHKYLCVSFGTCWDFKCLVEVTFDWWRKPRTQADDRTSGRCSTWSAFVCVCVF